MLAHLRVGVSREIGNDLVGGDAHLDGPADGLAGDFAGDEVGEAVFQCGEQSNQGDL